MPSCNGSGPAHRTEGRDRFLILADDLTGAADAAVALAGAGRHSDVVLDIARALDAPSQVVAVDLNTRAMSECAAAETVRRAAAALSGGGRQWFKKIDSTLRGHVGTELAALCRGIRAAGSYAEEWPALCLVAPAHPALGRTLEGGQLRVHGGIPADAEQWGAADKPNVLASELETKGLICATLDILTLRSLDAQALSGRMEAVAALPTALVPALVCDAQTMDDMRRVAAAAQRARVACVWVGSGGLAQALAVDACDAWQDISGEVPVVRSSASRAFIVGSFSSVASEQVRALVHGDEVACVALSVDELTGDQDGAAASRIDQLLANGRDLVLRIDPRLAVRPELADALARGLAGIMAPRLDRVAAVVCCGGDTSRALLDRMGAARLRVCRSRELGSTLAWAETHPRLPIILKAGAFGDAGLLVRLRRQWAVSAAGSLLRSIH